LALVAEITRLTQITHPVPPRPAAEA
jgi:hypothetical protein